MPVARATLLLLPATAGGCFAARGDSCEIDSDEISMVAEVLDDGTTVRAEANFESGDRSGLGTVLELCEQDVLTINGREPTVTSKFDEVEYSITYEDPADAPSDFTFVLERGEEEETITAEVSLPEAFTVIAPQPEQEISRGAEFTLEWATAANGSEMVVGLADQISEECVETAAGDHHYMGPDGITVPDTGLRLMPAWTLAGGAGGVPPQPVPDLESRCVATFGFRRVRFADYPEGLGGGGRVTASVERNVDFYAIP